LDEELKAEETKDYLNRIETLPEKYNMNAFFEKQNRFGTIALLHNTDKDTEKVYINYKSRNQIEKMIDVMKNILEADKSYMQNEQALVTWMFINHITLHRYYRICQLLADYNMTKKYAPMDFLLFLKEIRKVKDNSK
jgi:transposase